MANNFIENTAHNLRYFWDSKNKQVISGNATELLSHQMIGWQCVDTRFLQDVQRYGMYDINGWIYIPKEELDKEFLTQLYLLGVDI